MLTLTERFYLHRNMTAVLLEPTFNWDLPHLAVQGGHPGEFPVGRQEGVCTLCVHARADKCAWVCTWDICTQIKQFLATTS